MNLDRLIASLIDSNRKGDYLDFREEPHEKKASLLHDILFLVNSLFNGNRYLILGVTGPKAGTKVVGLKPDQSNQKEQIHFIDFLPLFLSQAYQYHQQLTIHST